MNRKSAKIWFLALRPFSLTASLIPVLLGGILGLRAGGGWLLAACALAMTCLQISSNLISDRDDYVTGVDTKTSYGSSRMLVDGFLPPEAVLRAGLGFLAAGCLLGLYIALRAGVAVLALGLLGACSAYFYTRQPFALKYRGMGIPLVFLMYGPLPTLGAYYVQTGSFAQMPFVLSIPIGLLTTAILHANDLRDIAHDRSAGIRTFSMAVGARAAGRVYAGFLFGAYAVVLTLLLTRHVGLWSAAVFLTIPLAVRNLRGLRSEMQVRTLDKQTALLQMLFGATLIVSVALPGV